MIVSDALVGASIVSFVLALILTLVVREIAKRNAVLDHPNHRSSHSAPVPRLGGLAIAAAAIVGSILAAQHLDGWLVPLGLGALILAVFGYVDDTRTLGPLPKYVLQLAAAILGAAALRPTFQFSLPPFDVQLGETLSFFIAVFWITAVINVYNFVDGVDGLAAGVGVLSVVGLVITGNGFASFFLLPLAGALLGFLVWNVNPGSIFMGDSGSQFVGFGLAVGALGPQGAAVGAVPVLIVFSPIIFDAAFTIVRRGVNRQNIIASHNEHLYQRLCQHGYSHRTVANFYYLFTGLAVLAAAGYANTEAPQRILYPLCMLILLLVYSMFVTALDRRVLSGVS